MRRDFDYVTMEDYSRDMAAHSSHAAGIIDELKRQKRDAERRMIAVVLAVGGAVSVSHADIMDADRALVRIERDDANDKFILTATR